MFKFNVIDYNEGDTKKVLYISTLQELKNFKEENDYKQVWTDFNSGILWVTKYGRFSQR